MISRFFRRRAVWVVLDREEAFTLGVTASIESAKALAEADAGPLTWHERRDGRLHSTTFDYEIRCFEVTK